MTALASCIVHIAQHSTAQLTLPVALTDQEAVNNTWD